MSKHVANASPSPAPGRRLGVYGLYAMAFLIAGLTPSVAPAELAWLPSASGRSVTLVGLDPVRAIRTFAIEPPMGQHVEAALLTPDNNTLLLIDNRLNRVVGIDLRDERTHWSIEVPEGPEAAWLSRDGRQLAICAERAGRVVFIDLSERRVVGNISIDAPPPEDCNFSPDGRWLVVSQKDAPMVTIIDLHSGRQRARIPVSGQPSAMLFAGEEVWMVVPSSNRLEVLDSRNWTRKAGMAAGLRPTALTASADGRRIYVANQVSGTVSVIDTATRRIVKHVPVGQAPAQLGLSRDGSRLMVADRQNGTAHLLDTFDLRPAGRLQLPHLPWGAVLQR